MSAIGFPNAGILTSMQHESFEERKDVEWLNKQHQARHRIKPLAGQVLIELEPPDTHSTGGITLPNRTLSPEEVQERHPNPDKPPGLIGTVRACGAWPKLKCGKRLMPEYGIGAKVVIRSHAGVQMAWDTSRRLRMVQQGDVLAVLT